MVFAKEASGGAEDGSVARAATAHDQGSSHVDAVHGKANVHGEDGRQQDQAGKALEGHNAVSGQRHRDIYHLRIDERFFGAETTWSLHPATDHQIVRIIRASLERLEPRAH